MIPAIGGRLREKDATMNRLLKAANFLKRGQYKNAVKVFEKTIKACPENADAWNSLGIALHGLRRYEDAVAVYERALAVNPSFAPGLEQQRDFS